MPHDILAVRYAVLAADTRSFARAASMIGVKQATLSRRISRLASRVGIVMFERSTCGAVPTEAGEIFMPPAVASRHAGSSFRDASEAARFASAG